MDNPLKADSARIAKAVMVAARSATLKGQTKAQRSASALAVLTEEIFRHLVLMQPAVPSRLPPVERDWPATYWPPLSAEPIGSAIDFVLQRAMIRQPELGPPMENANGKEGETEAVARP